MDAAPGRKTPRLKRGRTHAVSVRRELCGAPCEGWPREPDIYRRGPPGGIAASRWRAGVDAKGRAPVGTSWPTPSGHAQRSLAASLQELASGNLFQARVAVAQADPVLQRARALGVASAGAPGR